jgi:hypothetical protein
MKNAIAFVLLLASLAAAQPRPARGPLQVLARNPRYFTDGSGRAVYLTGSHVWQNLQDSGLLMPDLGDPPRRFDYDAYLALLERYGHNFIRLWRWETPKWSRYGETRYCRPHPWMRTGPGAAADGKPKFDLTRWDPEYFDRLRTRVAAAAARGVYVSVMLFEGWEFQFTDAWAHHPFRHGNNVNGVDGDVADGVGLGYMTLRPDAAGKATLEAQQAYVRKVVDTVNGFDNVLYEIANEAHAGSTEWQYHMIRYVKQYEAGKAKQHPVGMTFQHKGGKNATLYASPADWISTKPAPGESYYDDPPAEYKGKVILNDTDHLLGHTGGDSIWVWKTFLRGMNPIFMEELLPSPTWQDSARVAMGQTRRFAERINLAAMTPRPELAETRYCLADEGREYLVFQNGSKGQFSVDLRAASGALDAEWLDVNNSRAVAAKPVEGGAKHSFVTPFGGPAVLYLKRR